MENSKPKLKLKLSLARETLRSLDTLEMSALDGVVGGTNTTRPPPCGCTILEARTAPPAEPLPTYP